MRLSTQKNMQSLTLAILFFIIGFVTLSILTNISLFPFNIFDFLVWITGTGIAGAIVYYQIIFQKCFSLLTFASMLFLYEISIGYLFSIYLGNTFRDWYVPENLISITLFTAVSGYLLCIIGYSIFSRLLSGRNTYFQSDENYLYKHLYSQKYRLILLCMGYATALLKLFKPLQKIQVAGGFGAFMNTAMVGRFGNVSETMEENAFITLINMAAGPALAFGALGFYFILKGLPSRNERLAWILLILIILSATITSLFRSVIMAFIFAMLATYDYYRPLKNGMIFKYGILLAIFLLILNYTHYILFYLTAGWNKMSLTESIEFLLAGQGHFKTLSKVLTAHLSGIPHLYGEGWLESIFFFIPRFIWHSKISNYGIITQFWAGLPTWYQVAPTNTGELVAHWGWIGITGMITYGFYFYLMDRLKYQSPELAIGLFALILPRIIVDVGMGFSAVCISVFTITEFYILILTARKIAGVRLYGKSDRKIWRQHVFSS